MGDNFYIAFLVEDEGVALDESEFLKAIYLELKADNIKEMKEKLVAFGVRILEVPDPHLYFQAPGGQVLRPEPTRISPSMREPSTLRARYHPRWVM
jgi:hypothetical protein